MLEEINKLIMDAATKSQKEVTIETEHEYTKPIDWPTECTIGPGLEGAIACESKIGYVNGSKGQLIYRGYNIFDLCAHSNFEEVSFLLLHGHLPTKDEITSYNDNLVKSRFIQESLRLLMAFPIENMNTMASLRLGTMLLRQNCTYRDHEKGLTNIGKTIATDEDSIPMEEINRGKKHASFEFKSKKEKWKKINQKWYDSGSGFESCCRLIAGIPTIVAAIHRIKLGKLPIDPNPDLSHAANLLYMLNGKIPTEEEERIMDVALILHADHGMNASTFASLVIASTLSDVYFSVGAGIGALNGPLHGGANEEVIHTLKSIGKPENVKEWFEKTRLKKKKVMGFGHRVYKAYDPRAKILRPLAKYLTKTDKTNKMYFKIAENLETAVISAFGKKKGIFPNVDFFSGLVYMSLGIPTVLYTPIFAVSRVAGWTARVMEYLQNNRIFRPRAIYTGEFNNKYIPVSKRK